MVFRIQAERRALSGQAEIPRGFGGSSPVHTLKIIQIADFTSVFPEKPRIFLKSPAFFLFFVRVRPRDHSERRTSIGFCWAARHAG
jgi:hypothetical protein